MLRRAFIFFMFFTLINQNVFAFWTWTPETNKWINPKFAVKDTPAEQLGYSQEFYESKEYQEAIREFRKLIKNYPRSKEAAEAQYYIGLCLEQQNQLYKAFKAYQEVLDRYPFSERSADIEEKQYAIGNRLLEGEGDRNKFVQTVVGGDYDVIDIFKTIIKNAPYGEYAASSQYRIALYLQERGLFQESRDEFEKLLNDYPGTQWAKAAKYQIAFVDAKRSSDSQYDQRTTQAAVEEFEEFIATYPDAELSQKAKEQIHKLKEKEAESNFLIASFYEKQKAYKAARAYYNTVIENFKDTSWAVKALKRMRKIEN